MFTSLLKDMIKDTDEQQDEEIHRVRNRRRETLQTLKIWNSLEASSHAHN